MKSHRRNTRGYLEDKISTKRDEIAGVLRDNIADELRDKIKAKGDKISGILGDKINNYNNPQSSIQKPEKMETTLDRTDEVKMKVRSDFDNYNAPQATAQDKAGLVVDNIKDTANIDTKDVVSGIGQKATYQSAEVVEDGSSYVSTYQGEIDKVNREIEQLQAQSDGVISSLDDGYKRAGIPDAKNRLTDVRNKLELLKANREQIPLRNQNTTNNTSEVQGSIEKRNISDLRVNAIDMLTASAEANILQNNITASEDLYMKSVELKMQPIQARLDRKTAYFDRLLKSDEAQKDRVLKLALEEQKGSIKKEAEALKQIVAEKKSIHEMAALATKNGAPADVRIAILNSKNYDEAIINSGEYGQSMKDRNYAKEREFYETGKEIEYTQDEYKNKTARIRADNETIRNNATSAVNKDKQTLARDRYELERERHNLNVAKYNNPKKSSTKSTGYTAKELRVESNKTYKRTDSLLDYLDEMKNSDTENSFIESSWNTENQTMVPLKTTYAFPVAHEEAVLSQDGHDGNDNASAIDIAAPAGSPVSAMKGGVVAWARRDCEVGDATCRGGFGNNVKIIHPDGTYTEYAHLSNVDVVAGDVVGRGQSIGGVGNTGKSTGNHLHVQAYGYKMPFAKQNFKYYNDLWKQRTTGGSVDNTPARRVESTSSSGFRY